MANSARIDELKKKFDETPRRYFAPLANEYRKAGDPDQAIAICREFLPQQPGHMSGHIVYGQALFDAQQFEEARAVFDTALTLDPENLIALRQLGDIARNLGETATAYGWYQRVLDADPRNDEIAAILTTLAAEGGATPAAEAAPAPEPSRGAVIAELMLEEDAAAPAPEPAPGPAPAPAPDLAAEPEPINELPITQVIPAVRVAEATPEPPVAEPRPAAAAPPADELLDLEEFRVEPETAVAPRISTPRASLKAMGVEIDRSDDDSFIPGTVAGAAPAAPEPEPEAEIARPTSEAFEMEELGIPMAPAPEAEAAFDPFATETMAELYLSQGHHADALRVYRQLQAQRPGDASLGAKVADLEAMVAHAAPESVPQDVPDLDTSGFDLATPAVQAPAQPPEPDVALESDFAPRPDIGPEPEIAADSDLAAATAGASGPALEPVTAAGPSIREFLAGLAGRVHDTGTTPGYTAAVIESEVAVVEADVVEAIEVGAAVEFDDPQPQPAAEADVPSTDAAPPVDAFPRTATPRASVSVASGGSIDALFGARGVSNDDQDAAATLAGAFGAVDASEVVDSTPTTPMSGAPARRATEELSLDSVFRESPAGGSPAPGGFSFDRFFASGTPARGVPSTETPAQGHVAESPDDDIEHFNSWLDGLKKR